MNMYNHTVVLQVPEMGHNLIRLSQIYTHFILVFSESELMFMFAICRRRSVCRLSVCRLSSVVCNVRAPYSGD